VYEDEDGMVLIRRRLEPEVAGQSVLDDGTHVPAETSRRLACDATRVVMRHDANGHVTEVGARTRTIPAALRRALQHRDRGCRFPGCALPFGQGHRIRHWAHGGLTTLSNLALLCRRHHRAVHEEGYQLERQADGELRFGRRVRERLAGEGGRGLLLEAPVISCALPLKEARECVFAAGS
jgi:5-methylcytosine-specific restriction endonuclease McrA